jgi:hypothetical protein
MRDGNAHSGRLPELYPSHIRLMAASNVIKSSIGCIDDNDLSWLDQAPSLAKDRTKRFVEAILIFADYDDGNHRWNTSEEPSVYTRS